MSAPTEPYAKSFGILVGVLILWVGTFLLWRLGLYLFDALWSGPAAP